MSKEYQHILADAMRLPQNELFALMQAILQKIQNDINTNVEFGESSLTWETDELFKELDKRAEEIRSGKEKPIPGPEVMAKLKKRIG